MLDRIRQQLRRVKWHASDVAWHRQWRAVRAVATPWMKEQYATARAKISGDARRDDVVIDREALDGWLSAAAPPGVPFDAVMLPTSELRTRMRCALVVGAEFIWMYSCRGRNRRHGSNRAVSPWL